MKLLAAVLFASTLGCSASQKAPSASSGLSPESSVASKGFLSPTISGDCHSPRWSPSGQRLLYLCNLRAGHEADQLYMYDRLRGTEQRITWQVGEIVGHDWVSEDRILYSSTTDEMKELLFRSGTGETAGSDVYFSDLAGENIQRITDEPGEDRLLRWDPGTSRALVLSRRGTGEAKPRWLQLNGRSQPAEPPVEACQPRIAIGREILQDVHIRGPLVAGVQGSLPKRKIFWKEASLAELSCAPDAPSVK